MPPSPAPANLPGRWPLLAVAAPWTSASSLWPALQGNKGDTQLSPATLRKQVLPAGGEAAVSKGPGS